jgi:hypothetical protein
MMSATVIACAGRAQQRTALAAPLAAQQVAVAQQAQDVVEEARRQVVRGRQGGAAHRPAR